jgi:chromosome segregation ATPase
MEQNSNNHLPAWACKSLNPNPASQEQTGGELREAKDAAKMLRASLAASRREVVELRAEKEEMYTGLNACQVEVAEAKALRTELAACLGEIGGLEGEVEGLKAEEERLVAEIAAYKGENRKLLEEQFHILTLYTHVGAIRTT